MQHWALGSWSQCLGQLNPPEAPPGSQAGLRGSERHPCDGQGSELQGASPGLLHSHVHPSAHWILPPYSLNRQRC